MNTKATFTITIILFLSINSLASWEDDLESLSWVEIAFLEKNLEPARGKISNSIIDMDLAKKYKVGPTINFSNLIGKMPDIPKVLEKLRIHNRHSSITRNRLLLVGAFGTGKSSFAEALAKQEGRRFYKVDWQEISGFNTDHGIQILESIFLKMKTHYGNALLLINKVKDLNDNLKALNSILDKLHSFSSLALCIITSDDPDPWVATLEYDFGINTIAFSPPHLNARHIMLKYHAKGKKLELNDNFLYEIAEQTENLTFEDLKRLTNKAFDLAIEEHSHFVNRDVQSLVSDNLLNSTNCQNSEIVIQEKHYLIATYLIQNTKSANLLARMLLYEYFLEKKNIHTNAEMIDLLAQESMGFSAQDIEFVVESLHNQFGFKSEYMIDDFYQCLLTDHRIKLNDLIMRKKMLWYFLEHKKTDFEKCAIEALAYYAADDFTALELGLIITRAAELAESENSAIEVKHLIMSLYTELLKKSKSCYLAGSYGKTDRIDYKTKINPAYDAKDILIQYFLEKVPHELSEDQILSLVFTEQPLWMSWYTWGKFIETAKEHAIITNSSKLKFEHFKTAAKGFNIVIVERCKQGIVKKCYEKIVSSLSFIKNFPKWIYARRLEELSKKRRIEEEIDYEKYLEKRESIYINNENFPED